MTVAGPLAGRRLLVTRRAAQVGALTTRLRELGADVVEIPTLEVVPPEDPGPLREATRRLAQYRWLVLASANAAEAMAEAWMDAGGGSWPPRLLVASVGPATTAALRARVPDPRIAVEPADDHSARGLLRLLDLIDLYGARTLIPAADRARDELPAGLRARGALVDVVIAYRTVPSTEGASALRDALARGLDAVLFASPSAVEGYLATAGGTVPDVPAIAIGPTTSAAARQAGLQVAAVAEPSTADGLCAATVRVFGQRDMDRP